MLAELVIAEVLNQHLYHVADLVLILEFQTCLSQCLVCLGHLVIVLFKTFLGLTCRQPASAHVPTTY